MTPGHEAQTMLTPASAPSASHGWLSSSGSIDHGRFSPGAVLEGRYRIVGLLGRGGMGEVYRADDLRLGQQVAIKFLPAGIGADTLKLAQFHNEVRMAWQVSHHNVCRVHDIGEIATSAGAQLFITMEYVDGEDLAASLKRAGRFPEDKALNLTRQICAGLAAAHDRGVIHRDLKPANIMLDRNGQVRLMDFGLAAAGTADDIRAGTPAYMAPEQLLGREVTARSDIFALGLVLYELFTGKRVFTAKTIAELVNQQEAGVTTMPSEIVKGLDPAIDNAIVWCLDRDPSQRPPSALALSAALPGSDPLAAALAAGETPSPAMVAAAGRSQATVTTTAGVLWLLATLVLLFVMAGLADRTLLTARTPLDRSGATLYDRARDLARALRYSTAVADRASGFVAANNVLDWIHRNKPADQNRLLAAAAPPGLMFWYRTSLDAFVPDGEVVGMQNPSPNGEGMTMMAFDTNGRLYRLVHNAGPDEAPVTPMAWQDVLTLAGYNAAAFTETEPKWAPAVYADTRAAFSGRLPELPDVQIRIEAAAAGGRLASFRVMGPWNEAAAPTGIVAPSTGWNPTAMIATVATVLIVPGFMMVGALVARHNVRQGRGDRAGATRLFTAAFIIAIFAWLFGAHHTTAAALGVDNLFSAAGHKLFDAGVLWIFYLAAEPQVRRVWPHILITWSRLVSTGARDPLVGRDMLIGVVFGGVMTVVSYLHYQTPYLLGLPPFIPPVPLLGPLVGVRYVFSELLVKVSGAMQNAMLGVVGLALLRMVLRRTWLVFVGAAIIFTPLAARGQFQSGIVWLDLTFGFVVVTVILGVIIRFGLFAGMIALFTHFWTFTMPLTLSSDRQYFQLSLFVLGVVMAIACVGVVLARGSATTPRHLRTSR